ncbi:MAG TPA: hypothetical protein VFM42_07080, partial [Sphingomicrobium sp.]|nr:hypothetical protein [Sphingomicrobium sp.]
MAKNSGKRASASYVPTMPHPADPLTGLPNDDRIRSRKLMGGIATIIVDATGLTAGQSKRLEEEIRVAARKIPGVED